MKRVFYLCSFLVFVLPNLSFSQCGTGYTRDTLNWDYLDFIPNSGSYITPTAYTNLATSQTQYFTFGKQRVKITHNYSGSNIGGDVTTHTGQTGSYGKGADIKFTGNGQVNIRFDKPVYKLKFSVADIDKNQKITISSTSVIKLSTIGSSIIDIVSNNNTLVEAGANNTEAWNSSTTATLNVDIDGPVSYFSIQIQNTGSSRNEDGSYYISDISACNDGNFPLNYYHISKPFIGQGSYVVCVRNDSIYYVNVANGVAKFLFADYGHNRINSLAYDPYRHMVYYAYSLSGRGGGTSSTDYVLRRYDYDMDTLGIVCNDIRTLGIPLFDQSIESGAAAFYDGSLYIGIEGGGSGIDDRESMIWKIDFDNNYAPIGPAAQVFGINSDTHDWSDIGINDGILYDFDGSSDRDFFHRNLQTGQVINYKPSPSSLVPRQTCVDWTGRMYNVGSPASIAAGTIVPYNGDGTVDNSRLFTIKFRGVAETGSWGDAAEAFKPKTDFGDAPDTYDPSGSDPAVHERDDRIMLGDQVGIEWSKHTSADATGDGTEEDGLNGLQVIARGISNHVLHVRVFNKTGATATLAGWIDSNRDGVFQPSEGAYIDGIPSADTVQIVDLLWPGIDMPYIVGTTTFMRLRLTSSSHGMTNNNPTGYFDDGEVEDYLIQVVNVLTNQGTALSAVKRDNHKVLINWNSNLTNVNGNYTLERKSKNGNWESIHQWPSTPQRYQFVDEHPAFPISYYRVGYQQFNGQRLWSDIKSVQFSVNQDVIIYPNPADGIVYISIHSVHSAKANLKLYDPIGRYCKTQEVTLQSGENRLPIRTENLPPGIYQVMIISNDMRTTKSLIIQHR